MDENNTRTNDDPVAPNEAEQWLARLLDSNCTTADWEAFEQWRAASPAHASAYHRAEQLWNMGEEAIQGDPALLAAAQRAMHGPQTRSRYRWAIPALAAAALLVAAVLIVPAWMSRHDMPAGTDYRTAIGQRRTISLKDGSSVLLDTDSEMRVHYNDNARRVDLLRGRAQFNVHGDTQWPFVVHVDNGTVTAVGTRFQVMLDGDKVGVTLLHGKLAIATRIDGKVRHAYLSSRQHLDFDRAGSIGPVQPADMTLAKGWTTGKLFVHNWRLPKLLAAMNRYSPTQVVIDDPSLLDLRISGVFHVGDQKTLVLALENGWPISATRPDPNHVVLTRK